MDSEAAGAMLDEALGAHAAGRTTRRRLLAGGLVTALVALVTEPARADQALDVQILQTASSLEVVVEATYGMVLGLDVVRSGSPVLVRFAQTTLLQHVQHRTAFQAQTRAMGGKKQSQANEQAAVVVEQARGTLRAPLDVVILAEVLETVATQTYLANCAQVSDLPTRSLLASVMGVESQHAGFLRLVRSLLEAGTPDLLKIPIGADASQLPPATGDIAVPDALEPVAGALAAGSGAVP